MPPPATRRPAGLRFVERPPALPEKLPRMDIAIFAGFASAGPLHRPVVVEDAAHFAALFGEDLPLAWDAEASRPTCACLGPAVRAFFRNGGRRCWILRVAGPAETSLFPLPGLLRRDAAGLTPAAARARSPGGGADALCVATALSTRPFEVLTWHAAKLGVELAGGDAFRAGDLLRLSFGPEKTEAWFVVQSSAEAGSPPAMEVVVQAQGSVRWLAAEELDAGPFEVRRPGDPDPASGHVHRELVPSPTDDEEAITLELTSEVAAPPGTFLQLHWRSGEAVWFQVSETQLATAAGSPPERGSRLRGRAFAWSDQLPSGSPMSQPRGEKLTFELRAQQGERDAVRLRELGCAPAHPRYWDALPDDAALFHETDLGGSIEAAQAAAYAALWSEAQEPRFPLAGDGAPGGVFLPIGMSALPEPAMAAQTSGRPRLVRDGLETFSSALFLDERLAGSLSTTLLADADYLRYQDATAAPLSGLYAALDVEEATLIAVPDAMHRGWRSGTAPPVAPPDEADPLPHPSWWHFLACQPPATPPAEAHEPERGHFLHCALRVLAPPQLEAPLLDTSGAFVLRWLSSDPDAGFILEEATQPDFADAVELWRGSAFNYSVLTRPPGHYYYRVRATAEGETSDWSHGVVVSIGEGERWELEPSAAFQPDALLDLHRALLRFCAARGDLLGVLALPSHFREDDALAYLTRLKSARDPVFASAVLPLGTGEERAFSYGAVHHPWLVVQEEDARLTTLPPDGAACGVLARRSLARGAWIAPANEAFSGLVALIPAIAPERRLDLLLAQINLIRQEPHGFLALNADTLSGEAGLRPINVRRLLILLRRAALRLGMTYVFEPNDSTLRRTVQGACESILQQLFMRGAFAGATSASSYRVVIDGLNTQQDAEAGRFRVDLQVAPALPMSFITVRLVQLGERATAAEIL